MNKQMAVKFWDALGESGLVNVVISNYQNKNGYPGKRSLERYVQVADSFKKGISTDDIARKTGFARDYVDKMRGWWKEAQHTPNASTSPEFESVERQKALLKEHLEDVANTAKLIASRVQELLTYEGNGTSYHGNILIGLFPEENIPNIPPATTIDIIKANSVIKHFQNSHILKFHSGNIYLKSWEDLIIDNITEDLCDDFIRFAYGNAIEHCFYCQICRGIYPPEKE